MVRRSNAVEVAQGTLVANTSTAVFPAKNNRSYLEIVNTHASVALDIMFGATAVNGQGVRLPAGQRVMYTADTFVHLGAVNIISTGTPTYQAIQC